MAIRFGWLLPLACLVLSAPPAYADELAQARETFILGDEHFSASRYHEARDAFEAVLKVVEVPAVAFKAGLANEKLGRLVRASELYALATQLKQNQYWADKQTQQKAQRDAAATLQALSGRIPTVNVEIRGDLNAIAEVTIDQGKLSGEALASPQRLDPGSHVVRAITKDGRSLSAAVTLAESERKTVTLDITTAAPSANVATPPPPVVTPPAAAVVSPPSGYVATSKPESSNQTKTSTQQWASYASFGVGAAGLVLGATAGLIAWSKYSDIKSQCGGSRDCNGAVYDRLNPTYDNWQTVSTVGFVVAGVGAAAGVTLLLVHPRDEAAPRASLTAGPGALLLKGAF